MSDQTKDPDTNLSRRDLIKSASVAPALASLAAGAGAGASAFFAEPQAANAEAITPTRFIRRYSDALSVRLDAAFEQFGQALQTPRPRTNDDDEIYSDFRGSFHKCLPQNQFGEVQRSAYRALRRALRRGDPDRFDAIPLDATSDRRLANPQAALAFNLTGIDPHATRMRAAPAFASNETAAEMGEVYWHALLRDVPFSEYGSHALAGAALNDLNAFSETVGPKQGGQVTAATLFRGETPGDLVGPYTSQFLLKDIQFGQARIVQRYPTPTAVDFMTDAAEWLAIQRGANPSRSIAYEPEPRYIYNARALGEYVHIDQLYQAYLFAAAIASGFGADAFGVQTYAGNPSQGGFSTLGGPDVLDSVAHVANLSLRAAWFQKWSVHRRLRPEVYAGRVHFEQAGDRHYGVSAEILGSDAVARLLSANGTAFLPLAFTEGSPTHPSYPAGHATVAGACCTVLKAFFNEDFVIPDPVEPSADGLSLQAYTGGDLTLGGEVNKLANNISLGRDLAGVHYRSDGVDGIDVGEQIGLAYLADISRGYNEDFEGFSLTRFDGRSVLVVEGRIYDV